MLAGMTELTLTAADSGTTRRVRVGESITVALHEDPMSGYRWDVESLTSNLQPAADDYDVDPDGRTGGGGTRTFRFFAREPGDARIVLRRARAWEPESPPAERFEVSLDVAP